MQEFLNQFKKGGKIRLKDIHKLGDAHFFDYGYTEKQALRVKLRHMGIPVLHDGKNDIVYGISHSHYPTEDDVEKCSCGCDVAAEGQEFCTACILDGEQIRHWIREESEMNKGRV